MELNDFKEKLTSLKELRTTIDEALHDIAETKKELNKEISEIEDHIIAVGSITNPPIIVVKEGNQLPCEYRTTAGKGSWKKNAIIISKSLGVSNSGYKILDINHQTYKWAKEVRVEKQLYIQYLSHNIGTINYIIDKLA